MPQFKYQLTNGKSLTLEGDAMPSDDEVEKAAKAQGVELVPHNQDQNVKQNEPTTPAPESKAPEKDNEKPSLFSSIYKKAVTPLTDLPSKAADYISNKIDPERGTKGLRSNVSAFVEGLGHEISGLTSPLNIGLAAASGGASLAESSGLPTVGKGLTRIAQAASIPIVSQGISDVISKPHIDEKLAGAAQAVLGGAGFASGFESPKLGDIAESAREPVGTGTPLNVELPKEVTQQDRPSGPWEGNTSTAAKPKSPEDLAYDVAREKFNMGRDLPDDKAKSEAPTAEFLGMQPDGKGGVDPLFNIKGGSSDGSTVGADTLQKMGIEVPEVPKDAANLNGDQLRQVALSKKSGLSVPDNIFDSFGGNGHPDSPDYANRVLSKVNPKGEPGLQIEDSDIGQHVVYRDPNGEPVGAAHVVTDKDGNKLVQDLAVDKSKGLLSGRAAVAIGKQLGEMGATDAAGTVSSDAANLSDRLTQKANDADDIFSRQGKSSAPSFGSNQGKAADIFPTDKAPQEVTADRQANPSKPRYRLDNESGGLVPIDKDGQQTGPAVFPGKELDPTLATESKYNKPPGGGNGNKTPDKSSLLQKIYDTPRGLMSVDLPYMTSAAFRQASPYVGTSDWFKSWVPAAKSFGSKEAYDAINAEINNRPLFQPRSGNTPSIAEQAGLNLTDLGKYSKREEALRGELAEKVPYYGKYVAASNRAYTAFLNSLRANRFEDLVGNLEKDGINTSEARSQVANAINTLTGRGKLAIHPNAAQGSFTNVEAASKVLSNVFFSPRKIASEVQMLNPATYIMTNPVARKELLSGALRRVATWWSIAGLAELSGATVSKDPTNPDFGKIKVGDTRIDPPGGLQQYLVLGSQIAAGGKTSSTSGKFTQFGSKFGADTAFDTASNFATNRFHPTAKYIVDLAKAKKSSPFFPADQAAQLALPMYTQDIAQIAQNNPNLIPMLLGAPLSGAGIGVQTYDKNSFKKPTFIPHNYDLQIPSAGR